MSSGGGNICILYKVINSEADQNDALYNAFQMPRGSKGPTLATVKQHCAALHGLNHLGPEGYHWRVCVEDKPAPGEHGTEKSSFSWWDIQDENAVLPVKSASQNQLRKFFAPPKDEGDSIDQAAKAAKGAFKQLGKAMTQAVTGSDAESGPPVSVVAFKLLDLVKMHDDFSHKNHGRGGHIPQPVQQQSRAAPARQAAPKQQARPRASPPPPARPHAASVPRAATTSSAQQSAPRRQAEASLMDFGPAPSSTGSRTLQHANSLPTMTSSRPATNPDETRAERLRREYAEKKQTSNRVWDDVDQRWVEVDPNVANGARPTVSAPPGGDMMENTKKEVGITLDPSSAVGKSASVQAAVNKRVNDMKESQAKALQEVREREERKKREEAEEDLVRAKLEPKIKAWSEEHGKKKQLRALLATLHTILWPGANWKQVSIGDLLDDSKMKRCYHKASRVVHPDKTHHLSAEERFLAKRIFDALTQAKSEYDSGK